MLPRASFDKVLSVAARAAKAGGACLGLALLFLSGDPAAILGLLAVLGLVVGGAAWRAGGGHPTWVRLLILVSSLAACRVAGGVVAALFGAVLLALGLLLRVRTKEMILGLAIFGGIVVALDGARMWLLLVFWALGAVLVALRIVVVALWRELRRSRILNPEKTRTPASQANEPTAS